MEKFHLILCDWHLGTGTGLDFLMYVRAHPDYGQTAFIMVTAEGTKEMVGCRGQSRRWMIICLSR